MNPNYKRERDLIDTANSLKSLFLAQNLTLTAMMHPSTPVLNWFHSYLGAPPNSDLPIDLMKRDSDEGLRFSAKQAFQHVQKMPNADVRKDLLAGPILSGALKIGNILTDSQLIVPQNSLTQFAKHFRNAAAHGDKWHFKGNEPNHPAHTRDVRIDRSLHGSRATFHTVGPYEYFRFLDEIEAFAMESAIQKAVDVAYRKKGEKETSEIRANLEQELTSRGLNYSNPAMQWKIAFYVTQIYQGIVPKVEVLAREHPAQVSE